VAQVPMNGIIGMWPARAWARKPHSDKRTSQALETCEKKPSPPRPISKLARVSYLRYTRGVIPSHYSDGRFPGYLGEIPTPPSHVCCSAPVRIFPQRFSSTGLPKYFAYFVPREPLFRSVCDYPCRTVPGRESPQVLEMPSVR